MILLFVRLASLTMTVFLFFDHLINIQKFQYMTEVLILPNISSKQWLLISYNFRHYTSMLPWSILKMLLQCVDFLPLMKPWLDASMILFQKTKIHRTVLETWMHSFFFYRGSIYKKKQIQLIGKVKETFKIHVALLPGYLLNFAPKHLPLLWLDNWRWLRQLRYT